MTYGFTRLVISPVLWLCLMVVRCWFRLLWAFSGRTKFLLPPIEDPALVQSPRTLALWIRQRKRRAESIVEAFRKRCLAVNPILNAIIEDRFEAALCEAREVDEKLDASTPEQREEMGRVQPLLGVPFTCKENIMIEGLSHTQGVVRRRGMKAARDAEVVRRLREAGAIPVAVTNVPELGLFYESSNLLYGRTANPYDISRTPGGSSGGEGALLASCGTPLSVGTDIGGSIRIPAAFCGTFGHKPSSEWVPLDGCGLFPDEVKGKRCLVAGPLGRSVGDLVLFLDTVVGPRAGGLAAKVEATDIRNLKIWWADSMDTPWSRPTERPLREALHAARRHLEERFGVATCRLQWPVDMTDVGSIVWFMKNVEETRGNPPVTSNMNNRESTANLMEEWLRWACGFGRHTFALLRIVSAYPSSHNKKFNDPQLHWKNVQKRFVDIIGRDGVLLAPVYTMTAPYHNETTCFLQDMNFCLLFNATEMPGTTVPLGLSKDGLPLALQVVTTPENDHLSLAVAAALEEKFGGWVSPSPIRV